MKRGQPSADPFRERSARDRWLTAVHEAAHAVVGRSLGVSVLSLSIDPRGEWWGRCDFTPALPSGSADDCRLSLTILAAGVEAEAIERGTEAPSHDIGAVDRDEAYQLGTRLLGLAASMEVIERELEEARARAAEILRQRWSDVQRLARAIEASQAIVEELDLAGMEIPEIRLRATNLAALRASVAEDRARAGSRLLNQTEGGL